jgi:hypothetical protein
MENNTKNQTNIKEKIIFNPSPLEVLLFSAITVGIYEIYWFYKTLKNLKSLTKSDISPIKRTIGLFIPIVGIVILYRFFKDIKELRIKAGFSENFSPGLFTFGYIFLTAFYRLPNPWGIIAGALTSIPFVLIQHSLNELWKKVGYGNN